MSWEPFFPSRRKNKEASDQPSPKKARFLLDADLDPWLVEVIAGWGWKAYSARDEGLANHEDEDLFAYAKRKDLVLITQDADFRDLRRFPLYRSPGVIILPGGTMNESARLALVKSVSVVGRYREEFRRAIYEVGGDGITRITFHDKVLGRVATFQIRETANGELEGRTLVNGEVI